jgi:coenzyme F420 biosynthesis associated uncharacterized protein
VKRSFRRGLALGAASGLAAMLVAEVVRPRGATIDLLDWAEVGRLATGRLQGARMSSAALADASAVYNRLAGELREPLLQAVGGLPAGARLPDFEAVDRGGWLDLNVRIIERVTEPLTAVTHVADSRLALLGRAGLNRYVALLLEFLGRRVLGQFDPQLLGREPIQPALYLVEPNVAAWEHQADLPGDDLRRWLILHEMTHAWQFEGHPWLREHLNRQVEALIEVAVRSASASGLDRLRTVTVAGPAQWELIRRLQATMSLVEGHGNLLMSLVGRRELDSFDRIDAAYRRRASQRSLLDRLILRLTGLELKMRQYRVGERFARAVHDRYGMDVLNRVWEGPDALPLPEELDDPERWLRRVGQGAGDGEAGGGQAGGAEDRVHER